MNFGLSLVRFALGITALWLIATAYQHLMVHEVRTAMADPPKIARAFDVHPVGWSDCRAGADASAPSSVGCTGSGAQLGRGAIPQN